MRFAIHDGKHLSPADRYPLSPRIRTLRGILAKFGPIAPASPPPGQTVDTGGARPEQTAEGEITAALGDRSAPARNARDGVESNGKRGLAGAAGRGGCGRHVGTTATRETTLTLVLPNRSSNWRKFRPRFRCPASAPRVPLSAARQRHRRTSRSSGL